MCCEKAKTKMMTMLGTSLTTSLWTRMMTIWGREQEDGNTLSQDDDKDVKRMMTIWGREQEDGKILSEDDDKDDDNETTDCTEEALLVRGD